MTMPYMTVPNGEGVDVYKQDADGKPMGKAMNNKPMTKAAADKYMAAMMANEKNSTKALTPFELIELEKKCGDMNSMPMMSMPNKLDDDDPRVNYDPLGGRTGDKACAACRWFAASSASCGLVYGDIVATGVCDLYLPAELPEPATPTQEPIPVVIVDQTDMGMDALSKVADPADFAYVPDKAAPSTWKLPIGDAQHARLALAAIGSNPPHGNKVDIPADALPAVRKKIEAAIRKHVTDPVEVKKLLGGKSLIEQFIDFLGIKATETPVEATDEGFKVLPDGRWRAWWTNNAKDLVHENFSAKAIDAYIARVDSGAVSYPELWYKHLPIRMGKADSLARIGYLTFATGTFYDTPVGQRGKAYYEAEQAAGRSKTNSHGYLYPTNMLKSGVYNAFNTFEITVLDPGEEANPYTTFEVKTMFAKVTEDKKKFDELVKIFGEDEVKKLVNFGETKSLELEQAGVDLKSYSSFEGIEVEDKTAQASVKELAEATMAGLKVIAERLDAITKSIADAQTDSAARIETSAKAVADLKAYVDEQFGYAPRASKTAATKVAPTDPQVVHLQKENQVAGQNVTDEISVETSEFGKSIFAHIFEAAKASSK